MGFFVDNWFRFGHTAPPLLPIWEHADVRHRWTSTQKPNNHKPLHACFSSTFESLTDTYTGVHYAPNTKEMPHMDAHHAEYLAASAAIHDQTPRLPVLAVGDFVSGETAGRRWSGHIEWIEGDRITIDVGGGWVAVSARDVRF